jgi:hypothetical protein
LQLLCRSCAALRSPQEVVALAYSDPATVLLCLTEHPERRTYLSGSSRS